MATLKQIEANRANARKSTGPKTAEGKDASSRNAIRHGLTSTRTIIGNEDASEFHQLRNALYRDYNPANTQEQILVDRIVNATWRTLRVRQMEQHLADMSIENWQTKRKNIKTRTAKTDTEALVISMVEEDLWKVMHRYDTQITRDFFRSVATLEKMQKDRQIRERQVERTITQSARKSMKIPQNPEPNWVPLVRHAAASVPTPQPQPTPIKSAEILKEPAL